MSNVVAVDLGASSYRIILNDGEKNIELYRNSNHLEIIEDIKYWNITTIYNSIYDVLIELTSKQIPVETMSINSWGCDFVDLTNVPVFDTSGRLKNQILGNCYLNQKNLMKFEEINDDELFELTGIKSLPFNTINRVEQINKPFTFIASYLNYLLTGYVQADYTIASTSQLLDKYENAYCERVLEAVKVNSEMLPPLENAGKTVKNIQHNPLKSIKVIFGAGHDTAYALNHSDKKSLILNIGSWIVIGANLDNVISFSPNYSYERGIKAKYKVVINQVGMNGFNYLIEKNNIKLNFNEIVEELYNVTDIYNLKIQDINPVDYDKSDMWQCNLASYLTALGKLTVKNIEIFIKDINPEINKVYIVGGGSANEYFVNIILSNLSSELTVEFGPKEATVIGNINFQKGIINGNIEK